MSEETTAHDASSEAIHKAKNAAQAIETARQVQLDEAVAKTAQKTKEALLEGLQEVFGDSDSADPAQMKILIRRVPILCTNIEAMHASIKKIEDNQTWVVRIIIGAVILALLKTVLLP